MKKGLKALLAASLLFTFAGCSAGKKEESKEKKVTVVLDWFPNTNHTGLYVAKTKDYYKKQGLDVEIIQPGENTSAEQMIASGKADFGVSYQENVTTARVEDIPVVSIGAVIQHNTSAFASLKKDNITSPKAFEGKRYGGWGAPAEEATLKTIMDKHQADYNKVQKVVLGQTDFFKSIGRDADFEWIYYGWDGIEAKRKGIELNTIMLKDLNPALDYYSPVMITSEKHAKQDKDFVKKFMKATTDGYNFAIKEPKEAADILIKNVPDINKELVQESQKWLSTKYQDDAKAWGVQKEEVWTNYMNFLYDNKVIKKKIDVKAAFTNEFLPSEK
ncbi:MULTISPECIES: ABC transporter substrate-binding protein [unclassified Bacillus (in: firmicutes)]|uniref:ABC transporter substrate-binding protein n=1 Tax=unclassified Bacillus (in: firmicutes) TaxID=185979 RepID=UPI0008EE4C26|nr:MULTISPECIES: ABC transporter substrate-binding protein [unclassified Bacillus (in: firmicutes)]SFJ61839.1 ABC-type nitrate/sulfonate/bicarbonate transport system, substrate-binding protein [Bacillus sp. 71mf]SFT19900.1 ABC-type nitrate/sulfonate/bicarbonate transport system, substrate-binding protein [Bacillus sp. 103mf]